uniref:Uncharacterized protein n=1 Tax=Hanusia phi TaxID=3032 RepID=A0A7S0EGR4_9CRYP
MLLELGGGQWPEDGIVTGPLNPIFLHQHRTLSRYARFLEESGVTESWKPCDMARLEGLRKEEEETSRKEEEEQEKLRRAAATGDSETVRRLLESKAHPTVGEDKSASVHAGISALHVAANARQPEIVLLFLLPRCCLMLDCRWACCSRQRRSPTPRCSSTRERPPTVPPLPAATRRCGGS